MVENLLRASNLYHHLVSVYPKRLRFIGYGEVRLERLHKGKQVYPCLLVIVDNKFPIYIFDEEIPNRGSGSTIFPELYSKHEHLIFTTVSPYHKMKLEYMELRDVEPDKASILL